MRPPKVSPAFTLTEMLVAMGIILVLATLAVGLIPRLGGNMKVAKAAEQLQGWLLIAKQRALRDQVPTGVRLFPDANGLVRELAYIQQTDDWTDPNGGTVSLAWDPAAANPDYSSGPAGCYIATGTGLDFSGGYSTVAGATAVDWPVQAGDYLQMLGGPVRRIVSVTTTKLSLASDPTKFGGNAAQLALYYPTTLASGNYRVVRGVRLLTGEQPLQLSQDVVIDTATNTTYGNTLTTKTSANGTVFVDLIFLPVGALADQVGSGGVVCLWVRDVTQDGIFDADPRLMAINKGTGLIAAHPVNPDSSFGGTGYPYVYAQSSRSSGL